jgi:hypothetical protein
MWPLTVKYSKELKKIILILEFNIQNLTKMIL